MHPRHESFSASSSMKSVVNTMFADDWKSSDWERESPNGGGVESRAITSVFAEMMPMIARSNLVELTS